MPTSIQCNNNYKLGYPLFFVTLRNSVWSKSITLARKKNVNNFIKVFKYSIMINEFNIIN